MRARTGRLGWLLALALLMVPATAFGQGLEVSDLGQSNNNYEVPPPDPLWPIPTGMPRYEDGGFFFAGEFLFWHQNNPLGSQQVAVRGFFDTAGVTLSPGSKNGVPVAPGTFIGSGREALNVNDLGGPTTYEPGWTVNLGWRFHDGSVFEVSWWHVATARYSATASLIPQNFAVGPQTADSFLTAPVFNFPIQFAGPDFDVGVRSGTGALIPQVAFGIWNAASLMTIEFTQRFDKVDIGGRIPVWDTDCWRTYALFGFRSLIMWERFFWRTVDPDIRGIATNVDVANYTNIVSNRAYGVYCGCGNEWYLGSNPLGALSILFEVEGSPLVDIVKERARYELGDKSTAATRSRNTYTFAPEADANLALMWYPTQSIQVRLGWDFMLDFNTIASPEPIDFNFGGLDPTWTHLFARYFNGFRAGISFVF
jgi:hypothetical protein